MTLPKKLFTDARNDAFRSILAPAGFRFNRYLYLRRAGDQLHGLEFQKSKYGDGFFVNVGIHYAFLPGFACNEWNQNEKLQMLDFLFRTRIDQLRPRPERPDLIPYPETTRTAATLLAGVANDVLSALEEWGQRWADPTQFLEGLTPQLLMDDIVNPRYREIVPGLRVRVWHMDEVIPPTWLAHTFQMSCTLAVIAQRQGQLDLSDRYLEVAIKCADWEESKMLVARIKMMREYTN